MEIYRGELRVLTQLGQEPCGKFVNLRDSGFSFLIRGNRCPKGNNQFGQGSWMIF
jgi:hypothetical protein